MQANHAQGEVTYCMQTIHNFSAAKIQQNKLRIDCATSSNFVNNLIDLNGQNIDVAVEAFKNSDNPYKELFGTCEYISCQQHYWFNQKKKKIMTYS